MNLIRNLIGLIITCAMLPMCMLSFKYIANIEFDYNKINDEIALCQLRENLLISYDMRVSSDSLNFIYKNKNYSLSLVNNKLILQPGTQIYLYDVDDLSFDIKNNCIYVSYSRGDKDYERVIASQTGIYINDFSSCDVLINDCDSN